MKVLCASVLILSLSTAGFAQTLDDYRTFLVPCNTVHAQKYTQWEWNLLSLDARRLLCDAGPVRPPVPVKKPRNSNVGIFGTVMALVGLGLLIPHGENYYIDDHAYCVDTYSVDSHGCTSAAPTAGALMLMGGVLLSWWGWSSVTVAPTASKHAVGARVSVKWGKR